MDYITEFLTGPFSLDLDITKWEWEQLWSPFGFRWAVGTTPLSNLRVIAIAWVIYFSTIIGLRMYMSGREPFKLTGITAAHNMILCLWSLAMFLGTITEIAKIAYTRGIDEVFCTTEAANVQGPLYYTMYIYYISKFYELLDTVILVLKKKPLIFLHWYHHAFVILMVWTWLQYGIVFSSIGMMANTLVHVFMYYYYYASSLVKTSGLSNRMSTFTTPNLVLAGTPSSSRWPSTALPPPLYRLLPSLVSRKGKARPAKKTDSNKKKE
ncbi:GNS1/SUR4 family-domain-containing protein [Chytridium lagenaria]|nr:GNS1/SUR4 family-domain-containing protein [Chytridium lagenaria]